MVLGGDYDHGIAVADHVVTGGDNDLILPADAGDEDALFCAPHPRMSE